MNVVIIEDETLTARRLEKLLGDYDPSIRVVARIPSVAGAVRWLTDPDAPPPDLIFMDIHLEDDLAFRIIEQTNLTTPIIFTTAYDAYALRAFKANSVDYLLKPIDEAELAAALDKFRKLRQTPSQTLPNLAALVSLLDPAGRAYKERFMITIGTKIRSVSTADIAYFFVEDKATWLTTFDGQHMTLEYSLDKLTTLLDPNVFFRVNRGFLVALHAIRTIQAYSAGKLRLDLRPAAAAEVFVSGDRLADFKQWLGK